MSNLVTIGIHHDTLFTTGRGSPTAQLIVAREVGHPAGGRRDG